MVEKIQEMIFHKVPIKVILYLSKGDNYASKMSRDLGFNRSSTVKVTEKFEENGIIESNKVGKLRVLKLTDQGKNLATSIKECLNFPEQG